MKRAQMHSAGHFHRKNPVAHFVRRLVRKRYCTNAGRHYPLINKRGNTVCYYTRFAAAGTGYNKQGTILMPDCLLL
jgi:hypothetical protein